VIDILDIGSGNVRSIKNWVGQANVKSKYVREPNEISSNLLIIPGVGSVGTYMNRIIDRGFNSAIREHVCKGGRLLGICLGFQIMAKFSEEDGGIDCLNLLNGTVERLPEDQSHNGWEALSFRRNDLKGEHFYNEFSLTKKRKLSGRVFYNHEYGFINNDRDSFNIPISKKFDKYSGMVIKDKIIGIQFHPEKSQSTGLQLLSMII
jgi:imidazole glycerol-phosphate synthase subunit HisH